MTSTGARCRGHVALLVELAGRSLRYDRHVKGALYAEAGVRDYWIVEVHRDPGPQGFERAERLTRGSILAPLAFPDVTLAVTDVLG
jgi:Uma2 family endonuclease